MKAGAGMVVSPLDGSGSREPASQHSMSVSPVSRPASRPAAIEIPELSPGGTPGTPGAERTTRRNLRSSPYPARGTSQPSTPNLSHTLDGMVIARSQSNTLDDFVLNNLPRSPLSGPSLAAARRHPPGYPSPTAAVAPASPAQRSGGGGGGASASAPSPPRRRDASGGPAPPRHRDAAAEETSEGVQAAATAAASSPASGPASCAASAPLRAGAHRHHGGCGFMEDEVAVHEPNLYAVYDGHGGGEASAIAAAELFEHVLASEGFARGDGVAALLAGLAATPTPTPDPTPSPDPP